MIKGFAWHITNILLPTLFTIQIHTAFSHFVKYIYTQVTEDTYRPQITLPTLSKIGTF